MPTEQQSTMTILGNPDVNMQAAYDAAFDTLVLITPGTTHVELHRGSAPWQRLWWSWTGAAGSWHALQAPSRLPLGPLRAALPAPPDPPATGFYIRKPYNPRSTGPWPGVTPVRQGTDHGNIGRYLGPWKASANTPPLVNGTGSDKQFFYAEDAGAVNFGAGAIAFVAGDWVIYDAVTVPPGQWIKATDDPRRTLMDDRAVEVTVSFTQD